MKAIIILLFLLVTCSSKGTPKNNNSHLFTTIKVIGGHQYVIAALDWMREGGPSIVHHAGCYAKH